LAGVTSGIRGGGEFLRPTCGSAATRHPQSLRTNSGSFATLAAILRASSLGSQTWFSFLNKRYGSPAALPIGAPFVFESETARLMFVRCCWPQSIPQWLFLRFPREDTTADYECGHDCPENPKLHLWHCGVLRRQTPLRTIIRRSAYQVLSTNTPAASRYCSAPRFDRDVQINALHRRLILLWKGSCLLFGGKRWRSQ
jgi:hypothetical protein